MGTEHGRKRQHVFSSIAGLILCAVLVAACAPIKALFPERETCTHVPRMDDRSSKADFDHALSQYEKMLSKSGKSSSGDIALMSLGLLSAHYANPGKDYKKALGYFIRLEKEFPESPLVEEAKIWISVFQSFEKAKQVDIEIEEKKKGIGK